MSRVEFEVISKQAARPPNENVHSDHLKDVMKECPQKPWRSRKR